VHLAWTAPTANSDTSALTDLDHFDVIWSQSSGGEQSGFNETNAGLGGCTDHGTTNGQPGGQACSVTFDYSGLFAGTYYFVTVAYNRGGYPSLFSGEAGPVALP